MNFKRKRTRKIAPCKLSSNRWLGNHKDRFNPKEEQLTKIHRREMKNAS